MSKFLSTIWAEVKEPRNRPIVIVAGVVLGFAIIVIVANSGS